MNCEDNDSSDSSQTVQHFEVMFFGLMQWIYLPPLLRFGAIADRGAMHDKVAF
jgi:hypothetical protein